MTLTHQRISTLCDVLQRIYAGIISDVIQQDFQQPVRYFTLPKNMNLKTPVCGLAFPCEGRINPPDVDDEWIMETDKIRIEMLKEVDGRIQVLQANDFPGKVAHYGDITAQALISSGGKGAIVDGNIRDTAAIRDLLFPITYVSESPVDSINTWSLTGFGGPIEVEGQLITRQTILHMSEDGVLLFDSTQLETLTRLAIDRMTRENEIRDLIDDEGVMAVYRKMGRW